MRNYVSARVRASLTPEQLKDYRIQERIRQSELRKQYQKKYNLPVQVEKARNNYIKYLKRAWDMKLLNELSPDDIFFLKHISSK